MTRCASGTVMVLRICGARRASRRRSGTSSICAFERHDVGIAGHREHRFAIDDARVPSAFPASPRRRETAACPCAAIASRIRSRSPTELPPENTTMSLARHRSSVATSASSESGAGGIRYGNAAVVGDHGRNREPIDVVDLARRERPAWLHDFVSCRENRHARPRVHVDAGRADGRERAHPARVERLTGRNDNLARLNVRASTADILRRLYFRKDPNGRPSRLDVSSTITTASAPSGIGAPVEISMHSPAPTVASETWPVNSTPICRSERGLSRVAPRVSTARTA